MYLGAIYVQLQVKYIYYIFLFSIPSLDLGLTFIILPTCYRYIYNIYVVQFIHYP